MRLVVLNAAVATARDARARSSSTDPSACWDELHIGLHEIVAKHFQEHGQVPRAAWMTNDTWQTILTRRDLLAEVAVLNNLQMDIPDYLSSRIKQLQGQIKAKVKADKKAAMEVIARDVQEAADHQDYRTVWVKGREFARTGLGPKRRVYSPIDADRSATAERDVSMKEQLAAKLRETVQHHVTYHVHNMVHITYTVFYLLSIWPCSV